MTYRQTILYLNSFVNYEKKNSYFYKRLLKPERFRGFLNLLDNPQAALRFFHVAGSKGKGSVCAFTAYILREAGFKVGLYTSPHLEDVRERIRILRPGLADARSYYRGFEGMISKNNLCGLTQKIKPLVEKYNRSSKNGPLTFFEFYTSLAFLYFKSKKVDYAVLETGMGGRLDATNVAYPVACAITPVSYEHTDKLGKTLKEIAGEKAGIIRNSCSALDKRPVTVVSALQSEEAMMVIRKRCRMKNAVLYEIGKDITWQKRKAGGRNQQFDIRGIDRNYKGLRIGLLGRHQIENAVLAVAMLEASENRKISASTIARGLKKAVWPGRLEVVARRPLVVLDGAQNTASAEVLRKSIKEYFSYKKIILVLGISQDKDVSGICNVLFGIADKVILTRSENPRACDPEFIRELSGEKALLTRNVREAVCLAKKSACHSDLILVTGSLFVVGEARRICLSNK